MGSLGQQRSLMIPHMPAGSYKLHAHKSSDYFLIVYSSTYCFTSLTEEETTFWFLIIFEIFPLIVNPTATQLKYDIPMLEIKYGN